MFGSSPNSGLMTSKGMKCGKAGPTSVLWAAAAIMWYYFQQWDNFPASLAIPHFPPHPASATYLSAGRRREGGKKEGTGRKEPLHTPFLAHAAPPKTFPDLSHPMCLSRNMEHLLCTLPNMLHSHELFPTMWCLLGIPTQYPYLSHEVPDQHSTSRILPSTSRYPS